MSQCFITTADFYEGEWREMGERKSVCENVIAEIFCEMCFNEGNRVHDSFVLYTTGSVFVQSQRTEI